MVDVNVHEMETANVSVIGKLSEKKEDWYVAIVVRIGDDDITLFFNNCEDVRKFLKDVCDGNEIRSVELEREKTA